VHYQPNFAGGDIVQSELFGHVKGAFTGAAESRRGLALEADGGSLFLDELDAIPSATQVLLLDLVQERRIRPMGSDSFVAANCRCIAVTNRPIDEALAQNVIRRDLHHRLAHCIIHIPALRDRPDDIPLLAQGVLRAAQNRESLRVFDFESDAIDKLQSYSWPGNIRELQGVVEWAAYRAQFHGRAKICADDVVIGSQVEVATSGTHPRDFHQQVEIFKKRLVRQALEASDGNYVHAASMLGVDRGTVKRLA
jgi:DNA-binding NtrC family response regulator